MMQFVPKATYASAEQMSDVTGEVHRYWNLRSCGADKTGQAKHSAAYFEEIEAFRYAVEPFIHSFAQFTRYNRKRILEIGVGAGTDFFQFVRAGARANGVDLTEEAIENVQARLALYGLQAESLKVCNAETLPYPSDSFDLTYSWGVIHHAEHMERVFDEIYRVTKPGGQLKIMVYNLNSLHTWYMFLRYALPRGRLIGGRKWALYHFQESYCTKAYTKRWIERLLDNYEMRNAKFSFHDQLIRTGAKFEHIRRLLQSICPERSRWYMAFEAQKTL